MYVYMYMCTRLVYYTLIDIDSPLKLKSLVHFRYEQYYSGQQEKQTQGQTPCDQQTTASWGNMT